MTEQERTALAAFAQEMSAAYSRLATALGAGPMAVTAQPLYGRANMQMPWAERVLRQCLILRDIQEAGGNVPQTTWYDIANRYGYSGRGLAGFFRKDGQGLLDLRKNGRVYITKRGRERLAQNTERVALALDELQQRA